MKIKCTYTVTWVYEPEESTMAELLGSEELTIEEAKKCIEEWMVESTSRFDCCVDNTLWMPYTTKFITEWIEDERPEEN